MGYLTFEQVIDWAADQVDDGSPYCEFCMTKMVRAEAEKGEEWHCPNSMCLDNEPVNLNED